MRAALVLAVLAVGGCADAGSLKALAVASSVATIGANDLPLTHCRFGPPGNGSWQISPIKYAHIRTGSKRNFEVVLDYDNSAKARITIELRDRFTIESTDAGPASLTHYKLIGGAYKAVARATIMIEESDTLWAAGDAIEEKGKKPVGEYFVFRIPDSDGEPRLCDHSLNKTSCQSLHIEYFDANEGADVLNQRPKLVADNVVPLKDVGSCGEGNMESGEGDTDEGPDQ